MEPVIARYREDKLRSAVRIAKTASWEELIRDLDSDPWGRPYKIVMNKLRPWAPPLIE